MVVFRNWAYLNYVDRLEVIDISNPAAPQWIRNAPKAGFASSWGLAVSGEYLFVAISFGNPGLQIIDISNPANPRTVGIYLDPIEPPLTGDPHGIVVSGNYAYVGGDPFIGRPLLVIDISQPANPQRVGRYDTPSYVMGVAASGNYAYVAETTNGLGVIDISNPVAPRRVGSYDTSGNAQNVAVAGNYAYVADYGAGLQVIDISNPAAPQRVGGYEISGSTAQDVVVSGNHAYLIEEEVGLQVIDIANPAMPLRVGTYPTIGTAWSVAVAGNTAYLGDWGAGLQILDISNPTMPQWVGSYTTTGRVQALAVSGNHAYLADYQQDWTTRLQIIDISDRTNPQLIGSYHSAGSATGVTISGNYAYLADQLFGLQVLEVSNPANPRRVGANKPFKAYAAIISGDKVLVAAIQQGLLILNPFAPLSGPPISLSAERRPAMNTLDLSVQGLPGLPVQIQRSSDLAVWQLWTNVVLASTPVEVTDPDASLNSHQFYRAFAR